MSTIEQEMRCLHTLNASGTEYRDQLEKALNAPQSVKDAAIAFALSHVSSTMVVLDVGLRRGATPDPTGVQAYRDVVRTARNLCNSLILSLHYKGVDNKTIADSLDLSVTVVNSTIAFHKRITAGPV